MLGFVRIIGNTFKIIAVDELLFSHEAVQF